MSGYASSAYAHNCRWVLADGDYCEKPVKYKMVRDDDENLVRYYDSFCTEHQIALAQQRHGDD